MPMNKEHSSSLRDMHAHNKYANQSSAEQRYEQDDPRFFVLQEKDEDDVDEIIKRIEREFISNRFQKKKSFAQQESICSREEEEDIVEAGGPSTFDDLFQEHMPESGQPSRKKSKRSRVN